jgi:hypothetical protein
MGLDIWPADRYDAEREEYVNLGAPTAQWSYGGFHRFRTLLAAEDAIDLENMAGFTGTLDFSGDPPPPGIPWDAVTTTLAPLLSHSDCDGELTPAECSAILPRLKEIRLKWGEADDPLGEREWDVQHLDALVEVVTYCAATGVNALFR